MNNRLISPEWPRWLVPYRALRSVKAAPKCITCDTEVCKSIAIVHVIVHRDGMAIACKLLNFAGVLYYQWLWSIGRSDLPRTAIETKCCMFLGAGERNMRYLSDNDLLSLVIDAEGQMARFVAKTLKVCSGIICCFPSSVCLSVIIRWVIES